MAKQHLFGAPRKITQQIQDRKISWLELFSDLVYVVIIHSITVGFGEHLNWPGLATFLILFYLIFNSWNNLVIYFDLHGNDSIRVIALTMAQIVLVALLAGSVTTAFAGHFTPTAVVYCLIQLLFMYMWWTTARYDPAHMLTTGPYLIAYAVGLVFFLLVPLAPTAGLQQVAMAIAIFIDMFALTFESANFNREFTERKIPFQLSSSLLERYGQFTMIILGESLANLIELFDEGLSFPKIGLFLLLIVSTITVWWLYYSLMSNVEVHATNYQGLAIFRGMHINFILFLTLGCFFLMELAHSQATIIKSGYLISLVLTLGTLTLMVLRHQRNRTSTTEIIISGGLVFLICVISFFLPKILMLILIDLALIGACVYREYNVLSRHTLKVP
ncbi:low temperature requirement protein A [Furfurilactobacillus sp. WILCCON 0119]